jgi:hypothetical protein
MCESSTGWIITNRGPGSRPWNQIIRYCMFPSLGTGQSEQRVPERGWDPRMREYVMWLYGWQNHRLDESQWPEVMHPNSVPWRLISEGNDYCIEVEGIEVLFSDMSPLGIKIAFHGRRVSEGLARRVLEEVLSNIRQAIGQEGRIIETYLH